MSSMTITNPEWEDIKNDIANAKALLDKPLDDYDLSFRQEMADYRRYMRGIFTSKEIGSKQIVQDNDFQVNISILRPNLYFVRPAVTVTPTRESFETTAFDPVKNTTEKKILSGGESSKMVEQVMNWYASSKKLNDQEVFKRLVDDALVCGFAAHFGGWAAEENEVDLSGNWQKVDEDLETRTARIATERLLEFKRQNGETIPGEQISPEQPANEERSFIGDTLTSERISPFNVLIDPECCDLSLKTARFAGIIYNLPTKYVNKVFGLKLNGLSTALFADRAEIRDKETNLFNLKRNEVILYMDMENRRWVYVVDELTDRPAKVIPWPWQDLEGFPLTLFSFSPDADRPLPIPDFRSYKQLVFKKMKLHGKLAGLLMKINKTFLADDKIQKQLDAIMNAEDGGTVPVKRAPGEDLAGFIKEVADFKMSNDILQYINLLNSTIERVTGISDFRRGLVSEAKRTAYEISQISGEQNLRVEERKETLASFIITVYQKRLQLLQENANLPQIIKITKDNQTKWPTWSKEDIQGEYDFDLDVGSMLKKNKEVLRKQTGDKYNLLKDDPWENHEMLVRDLHEAFEDKEIDKRVIKPKDPTPPVDKEKPKLSVSLKLEPADLLDPNVNALLRSAGVELSVVPQVAPAGSIPGANVIPAPGAIPNTPLPTGANTQVGIQQEALSV